jgi:hypothetical protein
VEAKELRGPERFGKELQRALLNPSSPCGRGKSMVKNKAGNVEEYLEGLPEDARNVIAMIRELILRRLPKGYRECMNWGMISYEIPLERYPDTYNKQPLSYLGLAAQKNYYALYLTCAYQDAALLEKLKEGFRTAGKKLDMGKSCLRFRTLEDLPLVIIEQVVGYTPPGRFIEIYESARRQAKAKS